MCISHCDRFTKLRLQLRGQVLLYEKLEGYSIAILKYRLIMVRWALITDCT